MTGKVAPTPESVFSQEYWVPFADKGIPKTKWLGMLASSSISESSMLAGQAAANIFSSEPTDEIPEGTEMSYSPQNSFTQPGNVVLLDMEFLTAANDIHRQEAENPPAVESYRSYLMENPWDVAAPATSLFKNNARLNAPDKGITVFDYFKRLYSPELDLTYARSISLGLFIYTSRGAVVGVNKVIWRAAEGTNVSGTDISGAILFNKDGSRIPPIPIGTTYRMDDKKKERVGRIRSARLIHRGNLSHVPEKSKRKIRAFAGRLANAGGK
jgi:hypothetical protein